MVGKYEGGSTAKAICDEYGVSRSTLLLWAKQYSPDSNGQIPREQYLIIAEIFETSNELFGVRRIRVKLKEKGYVVSEKRIGRLMKELGLYVKKNGPRLNSANDRQYQYYPNRLQRNFITEAPNMVWVSDITYARVGHDFLYLCVVIDLYARKVISYAVSEYINENLVTEAFESAYRSRACPKRLLFHSDQGTQYTAFTFRKKLREYGVIQSF